VLPAVMVVLPLFRLTPVTAIGSKLPSTSISLTHLANLLLVIAQGFKGSWPKHSLNEYVPSIRLKFGAVPNRW
jgi:hypothetical protein